MTEAELRAALEACAADLLLILRHEAGLHPDVHAVAANALINVMRALEQK
jgi:hypothetical protein